MDESKGKPRARDLASVQSLSRGLQILSLLAESGKMTATAIAAHLGVNQSTASRLLRSLEVAGLVHKPDFRGFAPDFGLLLLAGRAMRYFPEAPAAAQVCGELKAETGLGASIALLRQERLVYLAHTPSAPGSAMLLAHASDFPPHMSSLGLVLSHALGRQRMLAVMAASLERNPDPDFPFTPVQLHARVEADIRARGFLHLEDYGGNRVNTAILLDSRRGPLALALFSPKRKASQAEAARLLERGRAAFTRAMQAQQNAQRPGALGWLEAAKERQGKRGDRDGAGEG